MVPTRSSLIQFAAVDLKLIMIGRALETGFFVQHLAVAATRVDLMVVATFYVHVNTYTVFEAALHFSCSSYTSVKHLHKISAYHLYTSLYSTKNVVSPFDCKFYKHSSNHLYRLAFLEILAMRGKELRLLRGYCACFFG